MKGRFYIGARLSVDSLESLKVHQFKMRNDIKALRSRDLFLAVVAPFELNLENYESFVADLLEGGEDFFTGLSKSLEVEIRGIDFASNRKKNLLFLDPWLPDEIYFYREYIHESIWSHRPSHFEKISVEKRKLPIGRYNDREDLQKGLMMAQLEFDKPFSTPVRELCLFQKKAQGWEKVETIADFSELKDSMQSVDSTGERLMFG